MPGEIDTLEPVTINGVPQWLRIQSNDVTAPVLLVLHGGPGYAMSPLLRAFNAPLADEFVVVNWDQRGAGRSFSSRVASSSMTLAQLLDDLFSLTDYLNGRFPGQGIYLLGHSFGTILGLSAILRRPDRYLAYIAVGQVIGAAVNEAAMYEWALARARLANHKKAIRELTAIGFPHSGVYPGEASHDADPYETAVGWMEYFGGSLHGKTSSREIDDWLLAQPEYQGKWGRKWHKGLDFSQRLFDDPAVWDVDFLATVKVVQVPAYFLQGRHDWETPAPLVAELASSLEAPGKALLWFERSAHFPFYEESGAFTQAMLRIKAGSLV